MTKKWKRLEVEYKRRKKISGVHNHKSKILQFNTENTEKI